jgi:hypothetical protein
MLIRVTNLSLRSALTMRHHSICKGGAIFADKRRSLGRYSSLDD